MATRGLVGVCINVLEHERCLLLEYSNVPVSVRRAGAACTMTLLVCTMALLTCRTACVATRNFLVVCISVLEHERCLLLDYSNVPVSGRRAGAACRMTLSLCTMALLTCRTARVATRGLMVVCINV